MNNKLQVSLADFSTLIESNLIDQQRFDIDFDGQLKVQVESMYEDVCDTPVVVGFKIINAMDGYGNNVFDQYKDVAVNIDLPELNNNLKTNTMNNTLTTQQVADLKQIAVSQTEPISKMVAQINEWHPQVEQNEAQEWSKDILDKAGAELGFQTKYSEPC